jgi:hypothetical protein
MRICGTVCVRVNLNRRFLDGEDGAPQSAAMHKGSRKPKAVVGFDFIPALQRGYFATKKLTLV